MIYLHEPILLQPGMVDEYVFAVGRYCVPSWTKYVRITGSFKNACHLNEAIFVWEYREGSAGIDSCGAYAFIDREGMAWQRLAEKYRENWFSQWVEGVPFSPTVEEIERRQKKGDFTGNTLYYWQLDKVHPARVDDFLKAVENELVPLEEKRGMKLGGCYRWFSGCGGPGEIRSIWAVKDWANWGRLRAERKRDPEFRKWQEKVSPWRLGWSFKFWIPSDWSLLK